MSDQLPPHTPERLEERRDATMAIAHFLVALREPTWHVVLLEWLTQYEGLEIYLWPEEDPIVQVRDLLGRYIEAGKFLEPEQFCGELADLRFCRCCAQHEEGGPRWDPLRDAPFEIWTRGKIVKIWDTIEPWPSRDLIQTWLLIRFCKARTQAL